VIERAVILGDGDRFAIDEGWLKRQMRANPKRAGALHKTLVKQEKEMIEAALAPVRAESLDPQAPPPNSACSRAPLIQKLGV